MGLVNVEIHKASFKSKHEPILHVLPYLVSCCPCTYSFCPGKEAVGVTVFVTRCSSICYLVIHQVYNYNGLRTIILLVIILGKQVKWKLFRFNYMSKVFCKLEDFIKLVSVPLVLFSIPWMLHATVETVSNYEANILTESIEFGKEVFNLLHWVLELRVQSKIPEDRYL